MDNVGTGKSPVWHTIDTERVLVAVMDWAATQEDLADQRCGLLGRSFGKNLDEMCVKFNGEMVLPLASGGLRGRNPG